MAVGQQVEACAGKDRACGLQLHDASVGRTTRRILVIWVSLSGVFEMALGVAYLQSFGGEAAHWQRINHGPAGILYCGPPPR